MNSSLQEKLNNLPTVPGVYQYKDSNGVIIYVGKAKNLKNRVKSYFQNDLDPVSKTHALVEKIVDLELIEVATEFEALLLEAELIKKYRPKYNIALKDDKSYIYIVIRNEQVNLGGVPTVLPKLLTERLPDLQKKDVIFGPYPDSGTAKQIIRTLRKIIPFRDCSISKFNRYTSIGKPCLYGHLGVCSAPCANYISVADYKKDIAKIKRVLAGDTFRLLGSLKKEMAGYAKTQNYEQAAKLRDIVNNFEYVTQSFKTAQSYIDNPYLTEDIAHKALSELTANIPALTELPTRIECYDISNVSGKESVGSMVVALNGKIAKSEYRRFRIKLKDTPDDFGMLQEVLRRRLAKTDWPKPDLLVIDGGKGQISSVNDVLSELAISVPLIGLAKRFETIVYIKDAEFCELVLDRSIEGLKLLQRLRDEAHRFAQAYHHNLRLKKLTE